MKPLVISFLLFAGLEVWVYSNPLLYLALMALVWSRSFSIKKDQEFRVQDPAPLPITPLEVPTQSEAAPQHETLKIVENEPDLASGFDDLARRMPSLAETFDGNEWQSLLRNAKDGGANSILATKILAKTALVIKEGNENIERMLASNKAISGITLDLKKLSQNIQEISTMSKMVSINASIEAQRAGKSGQTFQIVAQEIGTLAHSANALTVEVEAKLDSVSCTIQENNSTCLEIAKMVGGIENELSQFRKLMLKVEELSTSQESQLNHFSKNGLVSGG